MRSACNVFDRLAADRPIDPTFRYEQALRSASCAYLYGQGRLDPAQKAFEEVRSLIASLASAVRGWRNTR